MPKSLTAIKVGPMRTLFLPALMVLLSCSTPKGLDPARLSAQLDMEFEHEIAFDFNHDGVEDTVKLQPPLPGSVYYELVISLSNKKEFDIVTSNKLIQANANPGASIELLENGSFKIVIDHSGSGRLAILREYTVSFDKGEFIVSGITISEYDRVNTEFGGSCDINLVTGEGEKNSKEIKIPSAKRGIASVTSDWRPLECKF